VLKSQERCRRTDRRYGADTAENETPSYSEVELEGNEVNPWPYLNAMQCKLCLPRETKLAAYKISTRHKPCVSM